MNTNTPKNLRKIHTENSKPRNPGTEPLKPTDTPFAYVHYAAGACIECMQLFECTPHSVVRNKMIITGFRRVGETNANRMQ